MRCQLCGFLGDELPDLARRHRARHAPFAAVLEPKPDAPFIKALSKGDGTREPFVVVNSTSSAWLQSRAHRRARALSQETRIDYALWGREVEINQHARAVLFNDDTGTFGQGAIAGAAAFLWRADVRRWVLEWAWIVPKARRQGLLSRLWPALRSRFGAFTIEPPLTPALQEFLRRMDANA